MTVFVDISANFDNIPASSEILIRQKMGKKRNVRAAQQHAQPVISDYDTDTANYTDNNLNHIPITAPPPSRTSEELNFFVLKRWFPDVESILAIAPFAVLYHCHAETQQWEKADTQGSLFVCQHSPLMPGGSPRYKVIILNRKSMENFDLELVSPENIEITPDFIIFSRLDEETETPQIIGIWMYSDDEAGMNIRQYIGQTILELAERAEQYAATTGHDGSHEEESYGAPLQQANYSQQQSPTAYQDVGQRIDLNTLFGKAGVSQQSTGDAPQQGFQLPAQAPQQAQQNTLLDLFRSASKG